MTDKVAIIGGGPAGMISAGYAAARNKDVTLFEKNEKLGKKLYITGKGRCNITNNSPIEDFFDNVVTNREFLYSAFYSFSNYNIIELLEEYGLQSKVERGNRVFPSTDKSSDVINTLKLFLKDKKANIVLNSNVVSVNSKGNGFIVTLDSEDEYYFNKIILATGGQSYPFTGSTGDGYKFAKNFGHTIESIRPGLIPIELKDKWLSSLQGLTLKNVTLSAKKDNKVIYDEFGEMIFTHFGISGPIVLSLSSYLNKYSLREISLYLDLKPALTNEKLEKRILRDFDIYKNKYIENGLVDLLPKKMIPIILNNAGIDGNKFIHQVTKKERYELVKTIKNFPLNTLGFRPIKEAIVTSGGVSTLEINSSTMESKLKKGLFFSGEIIDVDALTGGYNLQIAYSTGYLAGNNV
ncbi:MAG TPA: NAD(P)/FAD-dependent oxidoreductase [Tissierellales bacterium]|nr:NAD(P)/FAD-dependent oxidoreductase [Tissierellales bacterium]